MKYAAKKYASNQIQTGVEAANPAQLIVMIYERILDHLRIGKTELENSQYGIESFTKASDLIQIGLLAPLDYQKGGDIATNLKTIYDWALFTIIQGRLQKQPEKIQEIITVFQSLNEAWSSKEFLEYANAA
jgi:flagellar protein FliS